MPIPLNKIILYFCIYDKKLYHKHKLLFHCVLLIYDF